MEHSRSAGGVVVGSDGRIVVVSQGGVSWSLPKGRLEPGEDVRAASVREIAEETGITKLEFIKELGTYTRHKISKDGKGETAMVLKEITLFLYKTDETELAPEDPDNPEARWVSIDKVADLLTHPKDKEFFQNNTEQIREVIA
jgi:ADP-ribose pyrophosphatase YjhB (NUDIX family)